MMEWCGDVRMDVALFYAEEGRFGQEFVKNIFVFTQYFSTTHDPDSPTQRVPRLRLSNLLLPHEMIIRSDGPHPSLRIIAEEGRFVPLFLIHYVHKNVGRSSPVFALGIAKTSLRFSSLPRMQSSLHALFRQTKEAP